MLAWPVPLEEKMALAQLYVPYLVFGELDSPFIYLFLKIKLFAPSLLCIARFIFYLSIPLKPVISSLRQEGNSSVYLFPPLFLLRLTSKNQIEIHHTQILTQSPAKIQH
jgi:hypothetical protein